MPFTTDTTSSATVRDFAAETLRLFFPASSSGYIGGLFEGVEALFTGRYLDYQACDLRYHDFQHTLQVTVAYIDLFAARQRTAVTPLTHRQFELGLTTALFHDSGYLKLRTDTLGTGAKYTYCHVLRGCALAASYLPRLGLSIQEIDTVLGAIRNTGPSDSGMRMRFNREQDQVIANLVASADYLGQMAATDYPDELELLFNEFAESDHFLGIPLDQRFFKSSAQLIANSGVFWTKVVKPKLQNDFMGVYRFLEAPDGTHPYVDAIEHNLRVIAQRNNSASA